MATSSPAPLWHNPRVLAPLLLSVLAAAAPRTDSYVMVLRGSPVGTVKLSRESNADGLEFTYASDTFVRRGPTVTRNVSRSRLQLAPDGGVRRLNAETLDAGVLVRTVGARVEAGSLELRIVQTGRTRSGRAPLEVLPSSLVFAHFGADRACFPVVDETTGEVGSACGVRAADEVTGTLFEEAFTARMHDDRLEQLVLPGQQVRFEWTNQPPESLRPPDVLGGAVATTGLAELEEAPRLTLLLSGAKPLTLPASAGQSAQPTADGARVQWRQQQPPANDKSWKLARELTAKVDEAIPDKRPGPFERSPERVQAEGRGACVAHTALFLSLAAQRKLPARRVVGLVAAEARFWVHEWPQVQVAGQWYDVDPIEAEAPARAARVAYAVGEAADEGASARLSQLARTLKIAVTR
jgi:hypothetical protein